MRSQFKELLKNAGGEDLAWMQGYLEALQDVRQQALPVVQSNKSELPVETPDRVMSVSGPVVPDRATLPPDVNSSANFSSALVIYGTETGNSQKVATGINQKLKNAGLKTKLVSTSMVKLDELYKAELIVIVCSTHGDGEPPAAALAFYNALKNATAAMNSQYYAVLALGDSSYPLFCQTGKDIDVFFERLGARRLLPVGTCDVDYAATAEAWGNELLAVVTAGKNSQPLETAKATVSSSLAMAAYSNGSPSAAAVMVAPSRVAVTPQGGYSGTIRCNYALTDARASKEIRHIEIECQTPIDYLPGDSVAVVPCNDPAAVADVLRALRLDPHQEITWRGITASLKELLQNRISIRYLPARVMKQYENLTLKKLPEVRMDLIDILQYFPPNEAIDKTNIIKILEPITPRYYSIASSPAYHGRNEVHLTVADVQVEAWRRTYKGLCSGHLFSCAEGEEIPFKIQKNDNFRLPESDKDIIMIGPGTGIAPFRSFLYEREALGHTGRNWLFFGNRNFAYDFLYQTELLALFDSGLLTKINTAFSRDNDHKIYVQHRMLANSKEIYDWIDNGAYVYVCGSKYPMSKDVDEALFRIIEKERRNGRKDAEEYFNTLMETGRYKKDVY